MLPLDESRGIDRSVFGCHERLDLAGREVREVQADARVRRLMQAHDVVLVDPVRLADGAGRQRDDALGPTLQVVRDQLVRRVDVAVDEELTSRR